MRRLGGRVRVAAVGRLKEGFWRAAQADYAGRLRRYFDFEVAEVKDGPREGAALLEETEDDRRRIALSPEGRAVDSPGLAARLRRWLDESGRVAFLVGGPDGLTPEVRAGADELLSLSPLTFPHEMARVVLLEQLYRTATILAGEKYHR